MRINLKEPRLNGRDLCVHSEFLVLLSNLARGPALAHHAPVVPRHAEQPWAAVCAYAGLPRAQGALLLRSICVAAFCTYPANDT